MRDGCVSLDILFTRVSGVLHTATDSRVFVEQCRLDGVQKKTWLHIHSSTSQTRMGKT